jgi:radical SAM superfamily enzyme YgiQ (UPF0313 family)
MNIVICNFPPMPYWMLPAAPAVLAGACDWLGIDNIVLDLNLVSDKSVDHWAKLVLDHNPTVVAFSVFTYLSRPFAENLYKKLKEINPNLIIVAGGAGIKDSINGEILMKADLVIDGDGEVSWPKFLCNNYNLTMNLDFSPMTVPYLPSYKDYNISTYAYHAEQNNARLWIPVSGSRGCVRKCTFCEIHEHWQFSQRNPDSILLEIQNILKIMPAAYIHFTDSLVNGSMSAFEKLLDGLIELKTHYPLFNWGGQFIIRRASQCSDEYWKKIADSGAAGLEIGVETGSEKIRNEMGKHFSNDDLDQSLEYMKKYNITCVLLFLIGYPTETVEDYQETLDLLAKYKYLANQIITAVQAGHIMSIHPGTPVYAQNLIDKNIVLSKNNSIWFNKNNPTLTYKERIRRRKEFSKTAQKLGYTMTFDNHEAIMSIEENTKKFATIIKIVETKFI